MYILTAEQIRAWDRYTMEHEPITSINLMERAAARCVEWMVNQQWQKREFVVFCGKGNNGGDGLAMARMLLQNGFFVSVYVLESDKAGSEDFQKNLERLGANQSPVRYIKNQ